MGVELEPSESGRFEKVNEGTYHLVLQSKVCSSAGSVRLIGNNDSEKAARVLDGCLTENEPQIKAYHKKPIILDGNRRLIYM